MDELFDGSKRNLTGARGAAAADQDSKSYEANVEVTEDKARQKSQDQSV